MHILQNLRDINIILFFDIMESRDTSLLIQGECSNKDDYRFECDTIWSNLFDEYFKIKKDGQASNSISRNMNQNTDRLIVVLIQNSLSTLNSLLLLDDNESLAYYKVQIVDNLKKNIKQCRRLNPLDSIHMLIGKIQSIHDSMYRKLELNLLRVDQTQSKEVTSIERSLVNIQNILGYAIGDFKSISVMTYIALEQSVRDKIKNLKNK